MTTLSFVIPNAIATSNLVSSSVLENDYAAWAAGTTYAKDVYVISLVTHMIYQSAQAGNLGKDPTDIKNRAGSSVYWIEVGPTNRWAMFDSEVETQTTAATQLTVVLKPGIFNTLYLANVDADNLAVTVRDSPGGTVVYDAAFLLEGSEPADYDEYFWDPFRPMTDFLVTGIEQYAAAEVTVTLSKGAGTVRCGYLIAGDQRTIGRTLDGVKVKPKTYSSFATDTFGVTRIVRRRASTDLALRALIKREDREKVATILKGVLDQVVLVIGSDLPEHGSLRLLGLCKGDLTYLSSRGELDLEVVGVPATSKQ